MCQTPYRSHKLSTTTDIYSDIDHTFYWKLHFKDIVSEGYRFYIYSKLSLTSLLSFSFFFTVFLKAYFLLRCFILDAWNKIGDEQTSR